MLDLFELLNDQILVVFGDSLSEIMGKAHSASCKDSNPALLYFYSRENSLSRKDFSLSMKRYRRGSGDIRGGNTLEKRRGTETQRHGDLKFYKLCVLASLRLCVFTVFGHL